MQLSWAAVPEAKSYAVDRCAVPANVTADLCAALPADGCGAPIGTSTTASFDDKPPKPAPQAYCYRVRACVDTAGQVCGPLSAATPGAQRIQSAGLQIFVADDSRTVHAGQQATLHVSSAGATGTARYTWEQESGPKVTLQGATSDTLGFVAPPVTSNTLLSFKVIATDETGGSAPAKVAVQVLPVNNVLVSALNKERRVQPGHEASLHAKGSDPGLRWTWRQVSPASPAVTLQRADTPNPSFTVPLQSAGTFTFEFTGTDPASGAFATGTTSVVVEAPQVAVSGAPLGLSLPVAGVQPQALLVLAGPPVVVTGGTEVPIAMSVIGGTPPYQWQWTQTGGAPATRLQPQDEVLRVGVPVVGVAQTLSFQATVTDAAGAVRTGTAVVRATQAPQANAQAVPPTVTVLAPKQVVAGTSLQIDSGGVVTPAVVQTSGPVLGIQQGTGGTINVTAPGIVDNSASTTITVTGTDATGQLVQLVQPVLIIRPPLQAPPSRVPPLVPPATPNLVPSLLEPLLLVPAGGLAVTEGQPGVRLSVAATGGTGSYTYNWVQSGGPAVTLRGANTRTPDFDAPLVLQDSGLVFTVTVTTGNQTKTASVPIAVRDVPAVPASPLVLSPPPTLTALAGATTKATMGVSGGRAPYTWSWTQMSGPLALITGAATAQPSLAIPSLPQAETLVFQATVTDADARTQSATVQVNAIPAPTVLPPLTVSGLPQQQVGEQQAGVALAVFATGGDGRYTYQWTQAAGPSVRLNGADTRTPTFDAPVVGAPAVLFFDAVVTTGAQSATTRLTVVVNDTQVAVLPLTVTAPPQLQVTGGSEAGVALNASGGRTPYAWSWTQTSGPVVPLSGAGTPQLGALLPVVTQATTFSFQATVTDADGTRATATAEVVARPTPATPAAALAVPTRVVVIPPQVLKVGTPMTITTQLEQVQVQQTDGTPLTLTVRKGGKGKVEATVVSPNIATDTASATVEITGMDSTGVPVREVRAFVVLRPPSQPPAQVQAVVPPPLVNLAPSLLEPLSIQGSRVATIQLPSAPRGLLGLGRGGRGFASYVYQWTYLKDAGGPDLSLVTTNSPALSFTPPVVDHPIALRFRLTLTDGAQTTSADFTVNINPPTFKVGQLEPLTVNQFDRVILHAPAPHGGVPPYRYSVVQKSSTTPVLVPQHQSSMMLGDFSFTAPRLGVFDASLRYTFEFTVTDSNNTSVKATQDVLVNAPAILQANISAPVRVERGPLVVQGAAAGGTAPFTFRWIAQVDGATAQTLSSTAQNPSFALPAGATVVDLELVATDALGSPSGTALSRVLVGSQFSEKGTPTDTNASGGGSLCTLCGDPTTGEPCTELDLVLDVATRCPDTAPYCLAITKVDRAGTGQPGGVGTLTKIIQCVGNTRAYREWWLTSRRQSFCNAPLTGDEPEGTKCAIACYGDNCSSSNGGDASVIPRPETLYRVDSNNQVVKLPK